MVICQNARVLASSLLLGNESIGREIIDGLSRESAYNAIGDTARGNVEEVLNAARIDALLLSGTDTASIAYTNLIKELRKSSNYTASELEGVLNRVSEFKQSLGTTSPSFNTICKTLGVGSDEGEKILSDSISSFYNKVATEWEIRKKYGVLTEEESNAVLRKIDREFNKTLENKIDEVADADVQKQIDSGEINISNVDEVISSLGQEVLYYENRLADLETEKLSKKGNDRKRIQKEIDDIKLQKDSTKAYKKKVEEAKQKTVEAIESGKKRRKKGSKVLKEGVEDNRFVIYLNSEDITNIMKDRYENMKDGSPSKFVSDVKSKIKEEISKRLNRKLKRGEVDKVNQMVDEIVPLDKLRESWKEQRVDIDTLKREADDSVKEKQAEYNTLKDEIEKKEQARSNAIAKKEGKIKKQEEYISKLEKEIKDKEKKIKDGSKKVVGKSKKKGLDAASIQLYTDFLEGTKKLISSIKRTISRKEKLGKSTAKDIKELENREALKSKYEEILQGANEVEEKEVSTLSEKEINKLNKDIEGLKEKVNKYKENIKKIQEEDKIPDGATKEELNKLKNLENELNERVGVRDAISKEESVLDEDGILGNIELTSDYVESAYKKYFRPQQSSVNTANTVSNIKQYAIDTSKELDKKYSNLNREEVLVEVIKNGGAKINGDISYIAMRELLGDEQAYIHEAVARVLLSEGNDVAEGVLKQIGVEDLELGELTENKIASISSLQDLVSIAYSYTRQLKDNDTLLKLFLKKKGDVMAGTNNVMRNIVSSTLSRINIYGDNYSQHIIYDIFEDRAYHVGIDKPEGMSNKVFYHTAQLALCGDNIAKKALGLNKKGGDELLRRLIYSFNPSNKALVDIEDVVMGVGNENIENMLINSLKDVEDKASLIDDIVDNGADITVDEIDNIYNSRKLQKNIDQFKNRVSNPNLEDTASVKITLISGVNIPDMKKAIFIGNKEKAGTSTKKEAFDVIAQNNSFTVTSDLGGVYKDIDEYETSINHTTDTDRRFEGIDYVIVSDYQPDAELVRKINVINKTRSAGNQIAIVKNKWKQQGRFFIDGKKLKFSLNSKHNADEFIKEYGQMGIKFTFNRTDKSIAELHEKVAAYIDDMYGVDGEDAYRALSDMLGYPYLLNKEGKIVGGNIPEVDRLIAQSLYVTGKFFTDYVDLNKARNSLSDNIDFYTLFVNKQLKELGYEELKEIPKLDINKVKELFFNSVYNKSIVDAMEAKYKLFQYFGAVGIAGDSDKVIAISQQLVQALARDSNGYKLGILQPDEFVRKWINGEDYSNDRWYRAFLSQNKNMSPEEFNTLLDNIGKQINIEGLKKRLNFSQLPEELTHKMSTEGFDTVYKITYEADGSSNVFIDGLINTYGVRLGEGLPKQKVLVADEVKILNEMLDLYKIEMEKLVDRGGTVREMWDLKMKMGVAMDTLEQKIILTKYGNNLSDVGGIIGKKYLLPIADPTKGSKETALKEFNRQVDEMRGAYNKLGDEIRNARKRVSNMNESERIAKAKKDGIVTIIDDTNGAVDLKLSDVSISLRNEILNKAIGEFSDEASKLLTLTDTQLKSIDNTTLLNIIEVYTALLKYVDNQGAYSQLYYQLKSRLRGVDFFRRYAIDTTGYPNFIQNFDKRTIINSDNIDQQQFLDLNRGIYDDIMGNFFTEGRKDVQFGSTFKSPTVDDIEQIVEGRIGTLDLTDEERKLLISRLTDIYTPYTDLVSLPTSPDGRSLSDLVNGRMKDVNDFSRALGITNEKIVQDLKNFPVNAYTDGELPMTVGDVMGNTRPAQTLPMYVRDGNNVKVSLEDIKTEEMQAPKNQKQALKDFNDANEKMSAIINEYADLQEIDKRMATDSLWGITDLFAKSNGLQRIKSAQDQLSTEGDNLANELQTYVLSWYGRLSKESILLHKIGMTSKGFDISKMQNVIRSYGKYKNMDLSDLMKIDTDIIDDPAERIGILLSRYFNRLESLLGSADGIRGITTSREVNMALYHIGDCVNNISTPAMFMNLTSALSQTQILKYEKLIKRGDEGYNEILKLFGDSKARRYRTGLANTILGTDESAAILGTERGTGIDKIPNGKEIFNNLFNTDFDSKDINRILQAIGGYKVGDNWLANTIGDLSALLNKTSFMTRVLISRPFQLLSIPMQVIGYAVRKDGLTKGLGLNNTNLNKNRAIREYYGIGKGGYFEINNRRNVLANEMKAIDDAMENNPAYKQLVDYYTQKSNIMYGDDGISVLKKIKNAIVDSMVHPIDTIKGGLSSITSTPNVWKIVDNVKENANNIIDGVFSATIKDIAFTQAVLQNKLIPFGTMDDFVAFMNNDGITKANKDRLLAEVNRKYNVIFNNIMGLQNGGAYAQVGGGAFSQIALSLYNLANFRGQWGSTVLRQTINVFKQGFKLLPNLVGRKEGYQAAIDWISRTPEYQNFIRSFLSDIYWGIRAEREFNDDGDIDVTDIIHIAGMISQRFQGVSSGIIGRIGTSALDQAIFLWNNEGEEDWKDTLGELGVAMLNSYFSNIARNRKVAEFSSNFLRAWTQGDFADAWDYTCNYYSNLSQGALNYMMDELNNGVYHYGENTGGRWYIAGDNTNRDNIFASQLEIHKKYKELSAASKGELVGSDGEKIGIGGQFFDMLNQNKFSRTIGNLIVAGGNIGYNLGFDGLEDFVNQYQKDFGDYEEFDKLYHSNERFREFENNGYVVPKTIDEVNAIFKANVKTTYPGGSQFPTMVDAYVNKKSGTYLDNNKKLQQFFADIEKSNPGTLQTYLNDFKDYKEGGVSSLDKRRWTWNYFDNIVKTDLSDDSDYNLYATMMQKGGVSLLFDVRLNDEYQAQHYDKKKNPEGSKKSKTDWETDNKDRIKAEFVFNNLEAWSKMDFTTMSNVATNIVIAEDMGKDGSKAFEKYVKKSVEKDEDGNDEITYSLRGKYLQNEVTAFRALSLFEQGEASSALSETNKLLQYQYGNDSTGMIGTEVLKEIMEYIDELPNYTIAQKSVMKSVLARNNISTLQKLQDTEKVLGEDNYFYGLADNVLYNVNKSLSDAIQEAAHSYEEGNTSSSSGGHTATLSGLKAEQIKLNKVLGNNKGSGGTGSKKAHFSFNIPVSRSNEILLSMNRKAGKGYDINREIDIDRYKEIPVILQPNDTGKPKKIKTEKKSSTASKTVKKMS